MAYNALNNLIDAYIYPNGVQAITGSILNNVLKAMVSQLGGGYNLMGVAAPASSPAVNDEPLAYFAATAGTYTNFDGIVLSAGEVAVLLTSGNGSWSKQTIYNVPTDTADLANTAGFITSAVNSLVNYYTKTEIDTTLAGYTTTAALATALADYYNKSSIDAQMAARYTKSEVDSKLGDYYKKTETYDKDEVDSIVAALSRQSYIVAWDGSSTPVVSQIPSGVTVTYSGNTYTGTLAASASTVNKIYMVWNGTAYDMYGTSADGGYSWVPMGTTSVDLSQYATKAEFSQLQLEVDGVDIRYSPVFELGFIAADGGTGEATSVMRSIDYFDVVLPTINAFGNLAEYQNIISSATGANLNVHCYNENKVSLGRALEGYQTITNGKVTYTLQPGTKYVRFTGSVLNGSSGIDLTSYISQINANIDDLLTITQYQDALIPKVERLSEQEIKTSVAASKSIDLTEDKFTKNYLLAPTGNNSTFPGACVFVPIPDGFGVKKIHLVASVTAGNSYVTFYKGTNLSADVSTIDPSRHRVPQYGVDDIEIPGDAIYAVVTTIDGAGDDCTPYNVHFTFVDPDYDMNVTGYVDINQPGYYVMQYSAIPLGQGNTFGGGQTRVLKVPAKSNAVYIKAENNIGRSAQVTFYRGLDMANDCSLIDPFRHIIPNNTEEVLPIPSDAKYVFVATIDGGDVECTPKEIEFRLVVASPVAESLSIYDANSITNESKIPYEALSSSDIQGWKDGKAAQSFAMFENYLFMFRNTGVVDYFDIQADNTFRFNAQFSLASAGNDNHCNSAQFDKTEQFVDFPLLYVSACTSGNFKVFVEQLSLNGGVFSSQLVRTITIGSDIISHFNINFYSCDIVPGKNHLYMIVTENDMYSSVCAICKLRKPSSQSGNVTLTMADVVDTWYDYDVVRFVRQGAKVYGRHLYLSNGGTYTAENWTRGLRVYNTETGLVDFDFDLSSITHDEIEDVELRDNKIYIFQLSSDYFVFSHN